MDDINIDNKIKSYKDRVNSIISKEQIYSPDKKKTFFNPIKINIISISFVIVSFLIIFYILKFSKPEYICKKITNDETHFHEYKICIFKHVMYTFVITVCLSAVVYLGYFIYLTQFKK